VRRVRIIAVSGVLSLLSALFFLGCLGDQLPEGNNELPNVTSSITIADIRENPNSFLGKKVVISGVYMGWKSDEPPPVTRSDWVVDDGTGRIYVTGKLPGLDPVKDVGRNVTIVGYVKIANGKPYIEAVEIII